MFVIKLRNILAAREGDPLWVPSALKSVGVLNRFVWVMAGGIGLMIVVYMLTAPVHVDEGWFHNLATAKNQAGYYTFPAFYDVPGLDGPYTHGNGLFVQLYRLFVWLFPGALTGILVMRLFILGLFVAMMWCYLARLNLFGGFVGNMAVMFAILLQPVVLSSISRARPELLAASLLMLIFYKFHSADVGGVNWNFLLAVSIALFLIHPNGVLYVALLMLLVIETRNTRSIMKLWGLGAGFAIVYFLVFIDPNYSLYKEQFTVMFASGDERKFLSTLADVPWYIYSEFRDRYLLWEWRNLTSYPFILAATIGPVVMGLYAGLREKVFRQEKIYVLATMIFFLFLGNKFPGYLTYILPVLLVMAFYSIRARREVFILLSGVLVILGTLWGASKIVWNIQQRELYNHVVTAIRNEAAIGETVYAPLRLEPYLSGIYKYRTTTQKGKNDFYRRYSISPRHCIIVERVANGVWNHVGGARETIYTEADLLVQRIY